MSSRKKNGFRPCLEQLEQRDVPSATLGSIPGLATAAVNSDFNSHVMGALDQAIPRQMPPAGTYAAVGNAADYVVTIFYKGPSPSGLIENHNETLVRDGKRRARPR